MVVFPPGETRVALRAFSGPSALICKRFFMEDWFGDFVIFLAERLFVLGVKLRVSSGSSEKVKV